MKLLSILVLCLVVTAYANPAPWNILGGIGKAVGGVVTGVVGGVKDVVGGVGGIVGAAVSNITDLGENILGGAVRALYGLGKLFFYGIQRLLNYGRNIGSGIGCLARSINGLIYGFGVLIEQSLTIIVQIITVQRRCYTIITTESTILVGSLNSVTVILGGIDLTTLDILQSVTITSTQLIAQVNQAINIVFDEVLKATKQIVADIGSVSNDLSGVVSGVGNGLVQLVLIITKVSSSITQNGQLIANAVSNVTQPVQGLISLVQSIAQSVANNLNSVSKVVIEAVNALVIILSNVIQIVLGVLVQLANILQGISPIVQQILEAAVASFTFALRGAEQIYSAVSNCFSHAQGVYVGLQLNINIIIQCVSSILIDFTYNTDIIYRIVISFNQADVKLGVTEIVGGFNGSLKFVLECVNALLADIEIVIGSAIYAVRTIVISLGGIINDIVKQILSLLGQVVTQRIVQGLVNAVDVLITKLADQIEQLVETIKPLLVKAADNIKLALNAIIRAIYQITTVITVGTNKFCGKIADEKTVVTTTIPNNSASNTPVKANVEENVSFLFKDWKPSCESVLTTNELHKSTQFNYQTHIAYQFSVAAVQTVVVQQ